MRVNKALLAANKKYIEVRLIAIITGDRCSCMFFDLYRISVIKSIIVLYFIESVY